MNKPTKAGVIEVPRFHDPVLRCWEPDEERGGYRVGVWGWNDTLYCWFNVSQPPWPWRHHEGAMLCFLNPDGRSVLITGAIQLDGKPWLHVSVARQNRMPSYKDLSEVKDLFLGGSLQALQLFPPESNHINLHRYCLHLWACLTDDGLPDFTGGGASI